MDYGHRCFLFETDGKLRRVPIRVLNGLAHGYDRMPQYAGQRLRCAVVELELHGRKPVRMLGIEALWYQFDENGRANRYLIETAMAKLGRGFAALATQPASSGSIVDLAPRIRQRRADEADWQPTPGEINHMIHAIWPETAGRSIKQPEMAVGIRKRKPPMTFEAKQAMRGCREAMWKINSALDDLREPSLKAFIAQAEEDGEASDLINGEIWKGIARAAEKRHEILRARRSKGGTWIAVATATTWSGGIYQSSGEGRSLEHCKCKGRQAAVVAARELLRKHADAFSDDTTIEVEILPEVEWEAERRK